MKNCLRESQYPFITIRLNPVIYWLVSTALIYNIQCFSYIYLALFKRESNFFNSSIKKLKLLIFIILIFYYLRSCNVRSSIYPFLFSQTPFFEDLFPTRILHIILKCSYIYPHPPSHFLHPASGNRTFLPAKTYVSRLKNLRFRPAKRRKTGSVSPSVPLSFQDHKALFPPSAPSTSPLAPRFRFRIFAITLFSVFLHPIHSTIL